MSSASSYVYRQVRNDRQDNQKFSWLTPSAPRNELIDARGYLKYSVMLIELRLQALKPSDNDTLLEVERSNARELEILFYYQLSAINILLKSHTKRDWCEDQLKLIKPIILQQLVYMEQLISYRSNLGESVCLLDEALSRKIQLWINIFNTEDESEFKQALKKFSGDDPSLTGFDKTVLPVSKEKLKLAVIDAIQKDSSLTHDNQEILKRWVNNVECSLAVSELFSVFDKARRSGLVDHVKYKYEDEDESEDEDDSTDMAQAYYFELFKQSHTLNGIEATMADVCSEYQVSETFKALLAPLNDIYQLRIKVSGLRGLAKKLFEKNEPIADVIQALKQANEALKQAIRNCDDFWFKGKGVELFNAMHQGLCHNILNLKDGLEHNAYIISRNSEQNADWKAEDETVEDFCERVEKRENEREQRQRQQEAYAREKQAQQARKDRNKMAQLRAKLASEKAAQLEAEQAKARAAKVRQEELKAIVENGESVLKGINELSDKVPDQQDRCARARYANTYLAESVILFKQLLEMRDSLESVEEDRSLSWQLQKGIEDKLGDFNDACALSRPKLFALDDNIHNQFSSTGTIKVSAISLWGGGQAKQDAIVRKCSALSATLIKHSNNNAIPDTLFQRDLLLDLIELARLTCQHRRWSAVAGLFHQARYGKDTASAKAMLNAFGQSFEPFATTFSTVMKEKIQTMDDFLNVMCEKFNQGNCLSENSCQDYVDGLFEQFRVAELG